jgi:general secretion pathway protein M
MITMARAQGWWRGLDARERTMVTIMLVMLVAFVYWYGMFHPLRGMHAAAQADYDRAVWQLRAVEADAAAIRMRQDRLSTPPTSDALARVLLDSAKSTAVDVSRQRLDTQGHLGIEIDRVAAPALFAWLDQVGRTHGIAPVSLGAFRGEGHLRAEVVFDTQAP